MKNRTMPYTVQYSSTHKDANQTYHITQLYIGDKKSNQPTPKISWHTKNFILSTVHMDVHIIPKKENTETI